MKKDVLILIAIVAFIIVLVLGGILLIKKITESTTAPTNQVASADSTTIDVTNGGEHLSVRRGETDADTIMFDDKLPGLYSDESINWSSNYSFHMLGGTYTVQYDGVISGDVTINGKRYYDNDEHTYSVVHVYKGEKVKVEPSWKAWYTNEYSSYLVAQAVQAKFPTWSRYNTDRD